MASVEVSNMAICSSKTNELRDIQVVMGGTLGSFFKPEKNLEFFRLKNDPRDTSPGKLE